MSEQFTQEYIDYILSDEAKALQEKWRRKIGDWYIDARYSTVPALVGGYPDISGVMQDGVYWLPTLHDLLRIIEGAGWQWSRRPAHWEAWRPASAQIGDAVKEWAIIEDTEDMLAAAKLAVKALQC